MRLAIISDIHEDINSLRNAFKKIEKSKIDEIICLGDISGFSVPHYTYLHSRDAHKCLSIIRANCKSIVLGNHDIHAAKIIPRQCIFFNYPKDWYLLDYHKRKELSDNILWLHEQDDLEPLYKHEDIEYLRTLPEYLVKEISGIRLLISHYIYPNISGLKKEFYTYKDELKQHFKFMASEKCTLSFTGHSHIKGFMLTNTKKYKQYRYKKVQLSSEPTCIGIPPITQHEKRNGFCIFDSIEHSIEVVKL